MASGERFDSITRLFGSGMSRRQAIKLALTGAAGTVGVVALQQGTASAVCTAANCAAPNFCCPDVILPPPVGALEGTCTPPAFPQCCGAQACAAAPFQQCCPGTDPFNPAIQIVAPFCAPGQPPNVFCCGPIACTAASFCAGAGCCVPIAFPVGTTCCGPNFCPPGTVCVNYPPGTFTCAAPCNPGCPPGFICQQGGCIPVPAPSDRNIKENIVPVAW